jgi:hypothetical protein
MSTKTLEQFFFDLTLPEAGISSNPNTFQNQIKKHFVKTFKLYLLLSLKKS